MKAAIVFGLWQWHQLHFPSSTKQNYIMLQFFTDYFISGSQTFNLFVFKDRNLCFKF